MKTSMATVTQQEQDQRRAVIEEWLDQTLGAGQWRMEVASADASFRRYFRVLTYSDGLMPKQWVLMDAPPSKEDITPWLQVCERLLAAGLHAPAVQAKDRALGLVLMEDLGDRWLLQALQQMQENTGSVNQLYGLCLDALSRMQQVVPTDDLPVYSEARLVAELELFPKWFLSTHLGYQPTCSEWDEIESVFTICINQALQQPKVFVHRDYHSRNLLLTGDHDPGIIDFQDAVKGPITYDLVSLLRDCYIRWPDEQVDSWLSEYHQRCLENNLLQCELSTFRRWFDFMGLQRHLKVLGIFCRLWYRDGKAAYLQDLPLVLEYVLDVCERYDVTANFGRWLKSVTDDHPITKPREQG